MEPPSQNYSRDFSRKEMAFLRLAEKIARQGCDNHRHGCVIVKGGSVISLGKNLYLNGLHAEMSAINKAKKDLTGATIYICRIRKEQRFGLSAPCEKCEALIRAKGISKVVFSTNDINSPIAIWRI